MRILQAPGKMCLEKYKELLKPLFPQVKKPWKLKKLSCTHYKENRKLNIGHKIRFQSLLM